ncbi:Glycosyltransferase, catalytic subunit of cellulose synthase and poly-beta-1,6-N-acetylglucosamine synthase [Prevotellaceae bacterium HUN156]|jgi:cellulose synthase/poly-beta-1,6-N-acetylglucosamine synthase-like glycosyltransferase|nr:Glycosyltransferase, catalytic subunit of cellulose synthase and poly-beta-1,6-N-acetylglucosamine synthase [Prevotellaceae bacterium HUN156]
MIIWLIIHIIEIFLWILLAASGAYILFFALVSMLWKKPVSPLSTYLEGQIRSLREPNQYTFLILYPAYNEDRVIVNSVHTFLGQYYPYKGFHVAVISDHMQPETNEKLAQLPITLLQPVFEKSSKAKAMQYAMDQIKGDYDYVVILDADNVVNSDFLQQLNEVCNKGYKAIQCHRCAKNSNNNIAVLDGVSEEINNTIFRKAHNRIGLSSALIGSGMCFSYKWFKENVYKLSTAGEDRELEALLLRQKIYIHYEPTIHVYDEKVSNKDNFQKQRLRWMTAQIQSLFSLLPYAPKALLEGNIDYIDKTFQQALIPRSMLIVLTFILALCITLISREWCLKWWLLFLFICLSLYVSTPKQLRSHSVFGKLLSIPTLVWKMILNILKIDRKNTDFIHTKHEEN